MDERTNESKARDASKGGRARAAKLTPEERTAIAAEAALRRWGGADLPMATHEGTIRVGDIELPCYVLSDGRRMLVQRGLQVGVGMSSGGGKGGLHRIGTFLAPLDKKGIDIRDLISRTRAPVRFRTKGTLAYGYEATILADLCDVVLDARRAGALHPASAHIADRCETLMRGFARVGIIALVDEATGYQAERARDALAQILEKFIAKELRPWVRAFPPEFYSEMFRLRGWKNDPEAVKRRPGCVGYWTTDFAYQRLAPGVLDELKRLTPKRETGGYKQHLHRRLTDDVGHPKLKEHIDRVIVLMRAASSWEEFKRMIDRALPRYGDNLLLPFPAEDRD